MNEEMKNKKLIVQKVLILELNLHKQFKQQQHKLNLELMLV